jgi:sugar lactone lactonase YvrE
MNLRTLCAALLAAFSVLTAQAQTGVTIGAAGAPNASAALEVRSTTQGLLLPRLTSVQRENIAGPAAGLLIFQTDNTPGVYYYDGSVWRNLTNGTIATLPPGVVSTLAGTGTAGFIDGTGTAAQFSNPYGVACDASGNVYVADRDNARIRRIVVATGAVSTLAGSGTAGFADGTGTAARFNSPTGVACDASGNLYVADQTNARIRGIVVTTGAVNTLAGSSQAGFADGTGAAAQFYGPTGVACDASGNVYVADPYAYTIRRIVVATGVVSTLAGTAYSAPGYVDGTGSAARFNYPWGVVCDGSGNVYVADQANNRIRLVR